jgi:hypothetical protein
MKRTIAVLSVSVLSLAALAAPGAGAKGASTKHCQGTYYAPQYLHIEKISAKGTGCTVARGLSLAYMRAVTSSSGAVNHTGHCFGAHSYGHCKVSQKGTKFDCNHFNLGEGKPRGLVSCHASKAVVKFNIGS